MNLYILNVRCQTVTRPLAYEGRFPPSPSSGHRCPQFTVQLVWIFHLKLQHWRTHTTTMPIVPGCSKLRLAAFIMFI